jgi:hypothetical protein
MAPRKDKNQHTSSKKRRTSAASSLGPVEEFDTQRFQNMECQKKFECLQQRTIIFERSIQLQPLEYENIQEEITRRNWVLLATPPHEINLDIVKEFYANATINPKQPNLRQTFVRGKSIPYHGEAINRYLGVRWLLPVSSDFHGRTEHSDFDIAEVTRVLYVPERSFQFNTQGQPHRVNKKDMNELAKIWTTFVCANIMPTANISDLPISKAYLIWSIIAGIDINIGRVISEELNHFVLGLADPTKGKDVCRGLGFPALITGLCKHNGVQMTGPYHGKLKNPITLKYIKSHCKVSELVVEAPPAPPIMTPYQSLVMERFNHVELQQAANHRANTFFNDYMCRFTIHMQQGATIPFAWPTPEVFAAFVKWPGVSPHVPEGAAHQNEAEVGVSNEQDEGEHGA